MMRDILISAEKLDELIKAENCVLVDCRFDFSDREGGRSKWLSGHIPGARYAHLDDDLASPINEQSGRHPLPGTEAFANFLGSIGWRPGMLLVAYDHGSNAFSGRLWWLMKYFGVGPAALLDGGIAAWNAAGLPLESGRPESRETPPPDLLPHAEMVVSTDEVLASLESGDMLLIDARAEKRFVGEFEPLDTKSGHIPGAVNRNMDLNLGEDSRFLEPDRLRSEFEALLNGRSTDAVVHSCGSGVTACHNLIAMELAGLGPTRVYAGSWSEWIRDDSRPIATGQ
jgi:thiosulfate/3-mercaptopyruvate sulfurtransferase